MARASLREIRARAQRRTDNVYDTVFTRNISVLVTWVLLPMRVSPNAVSFVNFAVGVGGCALIGAGLNPALVITGILLVHLYAVLDSVDGELARFTGKCSVRGMFLEDWSAYAMMTCFPIATALYLHHRGAALTALVLAVLYAAIGRNAMPAVRRAVAKAGRSPVNSAAVAGWRGVVENRLLNPTNIRLVVTLLILLDLVTSRATPLLLAVFYGYVIALLGREAAIVWLALRGDLIRDTGS